MFRHMAILKLKPDAKEVVYVPKTSSDEDFGFDSVKFPVPVPEFPIPQK